MLVEVLKVGQILVKVSSLSPKVVICKVRSYFPLLQYPIVVNILLLFVELLSLITHYTILYLFSFLAFFRLNMS